MSWLEWIEDAFHYESLCDHLFSVWLGVCASGTLYRHWFIAEMYPENPISLNKGFS